MDELYEFAINYMLEYEQLIERSAIKRQLSGITSALKRSQYKKASNIHDKLYSGSQAQMAKAGSVSHGRKGYRDMGKIYNNQYKMITKQS